MEDHIVVSLDHLNEHAGLQALNDADAQLSSNEGSSSQIADAHASAIHVVEVGECDTLDEEHLIETVECRICLEEDNLNNLDIPCACRGTLKFAHRRCVQLWCNEKGDTICEICRQPYKPGYSPYRPEDTSNDIRNSRTVPGTPLDLHDPQIWAIAAVEHHLLEAEHDDYVSASISALTYCWSAILILMTLLLMRYAASFFNSDVEKVLTYIFLIMFRAAALTLPCYLMARTVHIMQNQRRRQEAAAVLALMLQAEQHQVSRFAMSPVPALR